MKIIRQVVPREPLLQLLLPLLPLLSGIFYTVIRGTQEKLLLS